MEDLKPLTVKGTGSFNLEASFKGQNALTFMKNMGYEFNSVGSSGGGTPWYSIYNWPALGSSARIMDALYTGNYLNVGIQFVTCAAEVFTFGNVLELNLAAKGVRLQQSKLEVHGNSLKSLKPTWGYKLYSADGTFLKNGITNKLIPETRYTKAFMSDKYMVPFKQFPNRLEAYQWEYQQNLIQRGPLNLNMH